MKKQALRDAFNKIPVPEQLEEAVVAACQQAAASVPASKKPRRLIPAVALIACFAVAVTVLLTADNLWQTAPAANTTTAATTAQTTASVAGSAAQTTAATTQSATVAATTATTQKPTIATTARPTTAQTQSVFVSEGEPQYWGQFQAIPDAFEQVEGKLFYTHNLTVPPQMTDVAPTLPEAGQITTAFDAATGTLTVSGTGVVKELYAREILYSQKLTEERVISTDQTVKHLVIEEGITALYNAFNDLHALESVTFPTTLTFMQDCFMDCDSLVAVSFPQSLKHLRYSCFYDCDSLKSITFGGAVVMDNPVTRVPVESSVNELGETVAFTYVGWTRAPFCDLDALEEVTIPDGSTLLGAFINCQNLKKATLGSENGGVTYVGCGDDYPMPAYTTGVGTINDLLAITDKHLYFGTPFLRSHTDFLLYAYSVVRNKAGASTHDLVQDWVYDAHPNRYEDAEFLVLVHYIRTVPHTVDAFVGDAQVTLRWEAAEVDEEYYICRQERGSDSWALIGSTTDTTYTDTTVEKEKIYRYALKGPEVTLTGDVSNTKTYYYEERPYSFSCISNDCFVW